MKSINYPFLYDALYRQPLLIEAAFFHSIHGVVFPRIVSGNPMNMEPNASIQTGKSKDGTDVWDGRRPTRCEPKVAYVGGGRWERTDDRFYWTHGERSDVAIIPVYGILAKNAGWIEQACYGVTDNNPIGTAVSQAAKAAEVKTVVFDFGSPGGQVTGIRELAKSIRDLSAKHRKTVYAFTDERCCSAAYWLASQANEIYATPSSTIGSIGTYLAWLDNSIKLQLEGYKLEFFGEGEHKGMGLPGKPLTQADRVLLQSRVTEINGWFTSSVAAVRPSIADETMQGQTFTGEHSSKNGLIDGLVNDWEEFTGLVLGA